MATKPHLLRYQNYIYIFFQINDHLSKKFIPMSCAAALTKTGESTAVNANALETAYIKQLINIIDYEQKFPAYVNFSATTENLSENDT